MKKKSKQPQINKQWEPRGLFHIATLFPVSFPHRPTSTRTINNPLCSISFRLPPHVNTSQKEKRISLYKFEEYFLLLLIGFNSEPLLNLYVSCLFSSLFGSSKFWRHSTCSYSWTRGYRNVGGIYGGHYVPIHSWPFYSHGLGVCVLTQVF